MRSGSKVLWARSYRRKKSRTTSAERYDLGHSSSGTNCLGFEPRRFPRKPFGVRALRQRLPRPHPASRSGRPEIEPGTSLWWKTQSVGEIWLGVRDDFRTWFVQNAG